jgi:tRNA (mo5U34)-methyltransferase
MLSGKMGSLSGSSADTELRIRALGDWFHNLDLNGVQTAPAHFLGDYPRVKWRKFAHALPADLRGKSVLDVGCNAGFYSFEMKRRGASRVLGVDSSPNYLAQARFAAEVLQVDVEFRELSIYRIAELRERFDVVLFMGVLYHLRHPLLALDLLHEHAALDMLVLQSMQRGDNHTSEFEDDYEFSNTDIFERRDYPRMFFVERAYASDPTNWWIPNASCTQAMLRSAGFDVIDRPEDEVYIARRRELSPYERSLRDLPELR